MSAATLSLNRIWSVRAESGGSWHVVARALSLAAAAGGLAIAAWQSLYASVLVGSLALVAGWALVGLIWRGRERDFAITLYLASMGIRLIAGVIGQIALARTNGFLFEDDRAYDEIAWRVVEVWRGEREGIHKSDNYLLVTYTYLLAGLYSTIGQQLLAAIWTNALVGSLAAVVTFALGLRLTSSAGARLAGVAMVLFPSLIFWSALNLKDTWVVLLIPVTMLVMMRFVELTTGIEEGPIGRQDYVAILLGVLTVASVYVLEEFRIYVYGAFGWLFPVWFLIMSRNGRGDTVRKLVYGIGLSFVLIALMASSGTRMGGLGFLNVKQAEALASNRALIAEKAETGLDIAKPPRGSNPYLYHLENLPTGVAHVLGAPTPWSVRNLKDLPFIPEMTAWYVMLALAMIGIVMRFKADWQRLTLPLLFTAAIICVLGLVEGNVGTIFRHRAMLMPTIFIAAGMGLTWILARRAARSSRTEVKAGI
jgi:hypothetical protein